MTKPHSHTVAALLAQLAIEPAKPGGFGDGQGLLP